MKICFLTHDLDPKGGWGRYASELVSGIESVGHEVKVLKEVDDGFEGEAVLQRGWKLFFSIPKIRKHIKNYDVVHALEVYPYGVQSWLASLFLRKQIIITANGTYAVAPLYNLKTSRLIKKTYKSADKVIAISNYTKNEILNKAEPDEIIVINPGVDLKKFYRERKASREKFILSVGALKRRKGYHISIPAFAEVKKQVPDLKYKIVGNKSDTNYFNHLKKLARESGVENDVEFISGISDKELGELYQTAQLFILTSVNHNHHFEGFGLVFLEAAAAGLPCVGTMGNGIEDAVKDGYNGILVEQRNIQSTAEAVEEILVDKVLQKKFSQNGYKWAKNNSLDLVVQKYLHEYEI